MPLTETIEPYEVLFRFKDGVYQGAHFVAKTVIRRDGVFVSESLGQAIPLKDTTDINVKNILGDVVILQDAAVNEVRAEIDALNDEAANTAKRHQVELAAKDATAQTLLARVAELESPTESEPSG